MAVPAKGERIKKAKQSIIELLDELKVAYDRELRYRLERQFPHDDIAAAITELAENKQLKYTNVPGRRGLGEHPNKFYCIPGTSYQEILPIMRKKLDLSVFVAGVSSNMGRHAELAWWHVFKRNNWIIYPAEERQFQGVNECKGRKASINNDIDFIVEKDGVVYGVEVKNSLGYPDDLFWKFTVATELDTIPLIIARWLNPAQEPLIRDLGGNYIVYRDALYSTTYKDMIEEIRATLGMPIEARDKVDDSYFIQKIEPIHKDSITNIQSKKGRLKEFLTKHRTDFNIRRTLGDRTR